MIKILNRYMEQDTYKENPVFDEDGYDLLQEILDEAGELKEKVPFETLVDNQYAEKALK